MIWKYILYNSSSNWVCLSPCVAKDAKEKTLDGLLDICDDKNCCVSIGKCFVTIFLFILLAIPYILIFFWIDLCNYLCCKNTIHYKKVAGCEKTSRKLFKDRTAFCEDLWEVFDGVSEQEWNEENIGICSNCRYKPDTISWIMSNQNNKSIDISNNSRQNLSAENTQGNLINLNDIVSFNLSNPAFNLPFFFQKNWSILWSRKKIIKWNAWTKKQKIILFK